MDAHETGHGRHASSQGARRELLSKLVSTLSRLVWTSWTKSTRTSPAVPSHWNPPATGLRWAAMEAHDDLLCDESEFEAAAAADVDTVLGTSPWELVLAPESEELDRLTGSFYPSIRNMPAHGCRFERLGWGREVTGI
ncbi:hypothetical protein OCS_00639 [Ophiocordyceps sinensis CO18]|uniref:Uncharacterized protein n=1 Tax=Ophiocordyceps sinensis (strain Co18 / CGMCC 3.14243) TaxID=911162 RepID=T5ADW9_OPHSC|nr:hypothetical protein OCS_00639 [Ophiocordyceps sinensis CO18]